MSKVLRGLVKAKNAANSGYVIGVLNEQLMAVAEAEAQSRRDGLFHPSQLSVAFCPREWALFQYEPGYELSKLSGITGRSMRIFANGHSLHERMQRWLADAGVLWGRWEYRVSGGTVETFGWRPTVGIGPNDIVTYKEVKLEHLEDHITGSTDGVVYTQKTKMVLEVKSINQRGFADLKLSGKPKASHIQQSDIYLHCLIDMQERAKNAKTTLGAFDLLPYDGTLILYENKDTQELLEFFLPLDMDRINSMMEGLRPKMHSALAYQTTGVLPGCRCLIGKQSPICARYERENPHAP